MEYLFIKSERINSVHSSLIEIHIADIHFGIIDPKLTYEILREQFLNKIYPIQYDIISIDGDILDHKMMSNSDAVMYCSMFVNDVITDAKTKNATIIIIHGTREHDANQLKLFYHYLSDPCLDLHIIENIQFVYTKGISILCIPEEYAKGDEYYRKYLFDSGKYDNVFMHGTIKGAIYGASEESLDNPRAPVFDINSFYNCLGPIISGHVHVAGCFNGYMYYTGSPIRWQYGEEQPKGFIILLYDINTKAHYVHFEEIESFKYTTINLDQMINDDPKHVIAYIKDLQNNGIDHVRVEFIKDSDSIKIISSYFANNATVKIKAENNEVKKIMEENKEVMNKYKEFDYILDPNLSEYEILTRYINQSKGYVYLTTDELINFVKGD